MSIPPRPSSSRYAKKLSYVNCVEVTVEGRIGLLNLNSTFSATLVLGTSRFWSLNDYKIGVCPKSYDKQFVRDWLIENKLDGVSPSPEIPKEIVEKTAALYKECYEKLVAEPKN